MSAANGQPTSVLEELKNRALGTTLNVLRFDDDQIGTYRVYVNADLIESDAPTPLYVGSAAQVIAFLAGASYMLDVANRRIDQHGRAIRAAVAELQPIH